MSFPTNTSSFPGIGHKNKDLDQPILLSALANGDTVWEQLVTEKSMDPDEPPLVFSWNLRACEEFYNKAVSYGKLGGLFLPPAPILKGAHPVGAASTAVLQRMQLDILTYVTRMNPGSSVMWGANGSAGLACTMHQCAIATVLLRGLETQDWFRAVLAHGEALSGPLGTVYIPRPRVSRGLCDTVPLFCALWM